MATGTTLVSFKQELKTQLEARAGLSGVTVHYAFPETGITGEDIWFGEIAETDAEIPIMKSGTKKVDETVSVPVVVQVLKQQGEDQETADLRAVALLAELQQELAETPRTITDIYAAEMVGWTHTGGQLGGSNHGSRFDVTVRIRARLEP
ncbi:hypothetical protein [Longimycelium tulufanense]|uniref:hypothetical protein n=1 Tax=Longimycelium tulufanense TaxID=907463 RepID=UPI00166C9AE4|nr:hypothetical protein [Longimycelium tulufanense]